MVEICGFTSLLHGLLGCFSLTFNFCLSGIIVVLEVHLVKTMVFSVVMYGCESWTMKKAEHRRIDAFELWYWRRRIPLDCKEIQPVHPKGDQPWCSLEGLMLKLKLQYFGHLM